MHLLSLLEELEADLVDKIPKQFIKFNKYNFIEHFIMNINTDFFDIIVIACNKKYSI